jgi:hypothetical protein
MKISNSKKALAKVIHENGGWVYASALWAAQDDRLSFFKGQKPKYESGLKRWLQPSSNCIRCGHVACNKKSPNWQRTILSKEEYFHLHPDSDDGWIEWNGGKCPVHFVDVVDVKQLDGSIHTGRAVAFHWLLKSGNIAVSAYRLNKQDANHESCKPASNENRDQVFAIEESEYEEKPSSAKFTPLISKSIEELAADFRSKLGNANRKQQEADDAKGAADAALGELEQAGKAIGLVIGISKQKPDSNNPLFTGKFFNSKIGKPEKYSAVYCEELCDGCGIKFGMHLGVKCKQ